MSRVRLAVADAEILEACDLPGLQDIMSATEEIDLMLLDLNMPGTQGLSALVHVRALAPGISVIVVSAMEDAAVVQRAIGLGASGFIPKSSDLNEIGEALNTALSGGISIPARYASSDLEPHRLSEAERSAARRITQLSPQQYRIAVLIAAGLLNKQIGWELDITEATVKVHISLILRKLGVQNRTQVALLIQMLDFDRSTGDVDLPAGIKRR